MNRLYEQVSLGIASAVLLVLILFCFVIYAVTGFIAAAANESFEYLNSLIEEINQ